ncbi:MAG: YncE family protein, partial [Flavobacteriales bacterium]
DKAWRRSHPKDVQPVAYIIDTKTLPADKAGKKFKTVRIPDTPYGHFITPDSKYMVLGSYETGEIVKIDLETGTQVAKIKSTHTIFNFWLAPSGNYFLIDYDEEKCPRKVHDVRSATDLKLITSVLLDDLYSKPEMSRGITAVMDGRLLITRTTDAKDTLKRATAIYVHRLPENMKPNEPGSSTAKRLELAETIANGAIYAKRNNIDINPRQYDMGKSTSVSIASDNNVIVTGSRSLGDEFTAEEVIAKLTRTGEKIWETKLKTVKDAFSSEGMHIPTTDGGCVVYFMYYDKPNSYGIGRLAKIDGKGKVIYDIQFTYQPLANATYMTKGMEVLSDGSVKVYGKIYPKANDDKTSLPWTGTVSAEGKLVKSEY